MRYGDSHNVICNNPQALVMGYEPGDVASGFGGDCLPKDTLALVVDLEQRGLDYDLLKAVLSDNLRLKGEH